jgi:hypothetical protein
MSRNRRDKGLSWISDNDMGYGSENYLGEMTKWGAEQTQINQTACNVHKEVNRLIEEGLVDLIPSNSSEAA